MLDLTFEEKSIWISLVSILLLYGGYFIGVMDGIEGTSMTSIAASMLGIILFLVVIEIAGYVAITIFHRPETADERDEFINGQAARLGYFVLGFGVITLLGYLVIKGALIEETSQEISLVDITNLLLFVLVFSEVVHYAARLFYYRRSL